MTRVEAGMINVRGVLMGTMACVGADGLCNPALGCGCSIDDLAPCEHLNLNECVLARKGEDGKFYPL